MSEKYFDKIIISELLLDAHLGWSSEERLASQEIALSVTLQVDTHTCARTVDLNDTICYSTLARQYQEFVSSKNWTLVEELAEQICNFTLDNHPGVLSIQLLIKKFVVPKTSWVGVEIQRSRK